MKQYTNHKSSKVTNVVRSSWCFHESRPATRTQPAMPNTIPELPISPWPAKSSWAAEHAAAFKITNTHAWSEPSRASSTAANGMNANVLVTKCHGPEWKMAEGSKSNQNAGIPNAAGVTLRHISWARRMAPSSIREHTKTTIVTSTKTIVTGIRLANFNSRTIAKDVAVAASDQTNGRMASASRLNSQPGTMIAVHLRSARTRTLQRRI